MLPVIPLNPELTIEQAEIQSLARDFAAREIRPNCNLYEKEDLANSSLLNKIFESGLINVRIPEKLGGTGLSLLETCLIAEEIAFVCSGIASVIEASELATTALLVAGSEEQKALFLTPLLKETAVAGIAPQISTLCEPSNKLIAKQENNGIVLNGHCPLVINASMSKWFLVACPLFSSGRDIGNEYIADSNIAYFVVSNRAKGLSLSERLPSLGRNAADARAANFENVYLEPIAKIVMPNEILWPLMVQINSPIIAAGCLGVSKAAFARAVQYAQERKTFGVPIAKHQALSFMLADMRTDIEAASSMIYQVAKFAKPEDNLLKLALSAQSFALEIASKTTIDVVQIFGGYGYTKDYAVEKLMRDAKTYQIHYGKANRDKEKLGRMLSTVSGLT